MSFPLSHFFLTAFLHTMKGPMSPEYFGDDFFFVCVGTHTMAWPGGTRYNPA